MEGGGGSRSSSPGNLLYQTALAELPEFSPNPHLPPVLLRSPPRSPESYESVDAAVCVLPTPAPAPAACLPLPTPLPAVEVLRDEWVALYAKINFVVDQSAAWFSAVAALDAELLTLCPCPSGGVTLRDILLDSGCEAGAGEDTARRATGGDARGNAGGDRPRARVREIAAELSAAYRALASLDALFFSASAGVRAMNGAVGGAGEAYAAHAAGDLRTLVRALEMATAQAGAQFARIADLEAKARHVRAVAAGAEGEEYECVLRATVLEAEAAVRQLAGVREVLRREVALAAACRNGLVEQQVADGEREIQDAIDGTEEVQQLMNAWRLAPAVDDDLDRQEIDSSGRSSGIHCGECNVVDNDVVEEFADLHRLLNERMPPLRVERQEDSDDEGEDADDDEDSDSDDAVKLFPGAAGGVNGVAGNNGNNHCFRQYLGP